MTTLLLDAGNSRFKWSFVDDNTITDPDRCAYGDEDRAHAVIARLDSIEPPQHIIVSSVLDRRFRQRLEAWADSVDGLNLQFLAVQRTGWGVTVAYPHTQHLGPDRFAALIAAHHLYDTDCIIVDCGTAITIDAITKQGAHRGGLILPGFELCITALAQRAPGIFRESIERPALFATDTGQAVSSGAHHMLAAGITQITEAMTHALHGNASYIITGGDAERLEPQLGHQYNSEPALVLKGLGIVAAD